MPNNELLRDMREIDPTVIESLGAILKPFKTVTVSISTEKSSSISLIRPLLHALMSSCRSGDVPSPGLHELRETMFNDLDKRLVIS